jgi:hypothetical protein
MSSKQRRPSDRDQSAELQRRLREVKAREAQLNEKLHRLNVAIPMDGAQTVFPSRTRSGMILADEDGMGRAPRTRYQQQLENRARSGQAVSAFGLILLALALVVWLFHQLKTTGVL